MNKVVLCLLFSLLFFSCNKNDTPKPDQSGLFVKFFGGAFDDHGFSVANADDGGFYLAGSTKATGRPDTNVLVVKIDQYGNKVWERRYELGDTYDEVARDILVAANGKIIVTGYKKNRNGLADFLLLSIDKDSPENVQDYTFGDSLADEKAYNLVQASDGAFILYGGLLTGVTTDMCLLKTNLNDTVWNRKIGVINKDDNIGTLKIRSDGNLLWCGSVNRADGSNMRLVLADQFGNLIWDYSFEENDGINQNGYDMAFINGGGYILAGSQSRSGSSAIKDIYIVKTNSLGFESVEKVISGSGSQEAYSIIALDNNQYAITGYAASDKGDKDIYVAVLDENANVVTYNTYGGAGDDEGKKILKTNDGFIVIGTVEAGNNKMMAVYKLNEKLELVP